MKGKKKRKAVWLHMLVALSLVSPTGLSAAAGDAKLAAGQILDSRQMEIAPGAKYIWQDMQLPQGPEKLHAVEFDPRNPALDLQAGKTNGKVYGMQGVTKMADDADQEGNRVVAAINGDFYDMSTGVPLGLFMGEGEVLTSPPSDWFAFGLKNDGSSIYGASPNLKRTLKIGANTVSISHINRMRNNSEALIMYTSSFHTSTMTNDLGDEIVLDILEGSAKSGQTMKLKVVEVHKAKGNTALKEGQIVLSATGKFRSQLSALTIGDEVSASFELDKAWQDVRMAIGGAFILLKNGVVQTNEDKALHPRVGIGTKADGSIIMVEIDGRTPGFSEGVSFDDLARIMQEMGAVDALSLDGGGSATFVAKLPGEKQRKVINLPSDGGERKTANGILLVNKAAEGQPSKLVIQPQMERVLVGTTIRLKAAAIDANYHPATWNGTAQWKVNDGLAEIDAEGNFTAGEKTGIAQITADAGELHGQGQVEIVDELTQLVFPDVIKTFTPGQSVPLSVKALLDGKVIRATNDKLEWRVEGTIGSIDQNGVFTATDKNEQIGKIYVKYHNIETSMEVKVGLPPVILEDFESGISRYLTQSGDRFVSVRLSEETDEDFVRFGDKAAKLEYDFRGTIGTSGAYIKAKSANDYVTIPGYPERIGVWVYGDGQKHWLRSGLRDGNNAAINIDFVSQTQGIDFVGWKYLEAEVPKGRPLPLKVESPIRYMETNNANKTAGVIYVDQLRALYGPSDEDLNPPIIKDFKPAEGSIVKNNVPKIEAIAEAYGYDPEKHPANTLIDPNKIRFYLDGTLVQHTLYPPLGQIHYTPQVPLADGLHAAKIKVRDLSGNISEKEWMFTVDTGSSKISYEAPSHVYAGNTYKLNLKAIKATDIKEAKLSFVFDPATIDSLQLILGDKVGENNLKADIDAATGTVILDIHEIGQLGLTDSDLIGQIQYRVKPSAANAANIAFKSGSIMFTDTGDTSFGFFGLPVAAEVHHQLQLSWDEHGIVEGLPTTFKIVDESGAPVEGAAVQIVGSSEIGITDKQGELRTTQLTSEVKEYAIQAVKNDFHSLIMKFKVSKLAGTPVPSNVSVTMGADTTTSRAFTWHTDPSTEGTVVEVIKDPSLGFDGPDVLKFEGSSYLFNTTDTGTVRVHKAAAVDLEPGTAYTFRVGDGQGNYSGNGTLRTAEASGEKTKFIFLADSQATNEAGFKLWGDILKKAMLDHPDTEFVVQGGDLVEDGFKENEWNMWFKAAQGTLMNTTIVPVVGNHEVTGTRKTEDYLAHFNHPQNGIDSLKGSNFSFDYKNAHFIVLNSEYDFEKQKEWMRKDLAATDKKWKIVAFHRGPFGSMYDSEHIRNAWTPVFDEFQVDLVLNGHDHVYVRTYPMKNMKPTEDGEGTTYIVGGSAGPKFYEVWSRDWQKVTDGEPVQMYVAAEIDGDEMNFVVKTIKDRIVDQFKLIKIPVEQIVIDKPEVSLNVGESIKLNASVVPINASNKAVKWFVQSQTADAVVKITPDGMVTAEGLGQAVVRAQSLGGTIYAESVITVDKEQENIVEKVVLEQNEGTLKVGQELQLKATVLPDHVTNSAIIWSVVDEKNKEVATVSDNGLIKAHAPGTAVIRAMSAADATKYADFALTVEEDEPVNPSVTEVWLNKEIARVKVGESIQLQATVLPENVVNKSVDWSVVSEGTEGSEGIAKVNENGLVTGLKPGKAVIRAASQTDPTKYAQMILTVESNIIDQYPWYPESPANPEKPVDTKQPETDNSDKLTIGKGSISIQAEVKEGIASIELRAEDIEQSLKDAQKNQEGTKVLRIQINSAELIRSMSITLPKQIFIKQDMEYTFDIVTSYGVVSVPSDLLKGSRATNTDSISLILEQADQTAYNSQLKEKVGHRPTISLKVQEKGVKREWGNTEAAVKIAIPYKPTPEELVNPGSIVVWQIDDKGRISAVPNGKYDPSTGTVRFAIDQASAYAVAYVKKTFSDITTYSWAKAAIEALAARDIIKGTGEHSYAPGQSVTRADFVVLLVRLLGLEVKGNSGAGSGYQDVSPENYYHDALAIARELQLVQGVGGDQFRPKENISRQDMFLITARVLSRVGKLPVTGNIEGLSAFNDHSKIAVYAVDSLGAMVQAGIIQGNGQMLDPTGSATRAETAVFLQRVLDKMYE